MLFFSSFCLLLCILPLAVLCAEDFYKLLGIDKSASDREIKKAYRTLSKQFHPDKNPNDEAAHHKFVDISEAYEVLIDQETRKIYDQYGHDGLAQHKQGGGPQHHDPFDLFSRFFGGGGHFGHGGGQRRGPDMEVRVDVPLRDFYNGQETEFSIERQQICEDCEGSGSADGQVETCSVCGGRGMKIQKMMLAPGIFQQMQSMCDSCGGKGKTIKHACPVCKGSRVVKKASSHSLHIEKGMPRDMRIPYENEADESPDWVAGDLVVHLSEKEPELGREDEERTDGTFFRRKGKDLFWREVLSLREAWLGDWTRNLTHLDGHVVRLGRKRGQTVQPNSVEVIPEEGMPIWHEEGGHSAEEFGALHVEYVVVLPDQMDKAMEKEFWGVWEKWRKKSGVDLAKDSGRPVKSSHDEL
ncbi:DnaJ-domain-containing protein [Xylona heveae TC161]|uniref:DnaJ-domain-containing protein n=1 Tax=Xylona heveae (strain CBS 132557 / TC161) TaxID=1328760 RepID=A0A165A7I6_XYLHT|nr:DnaJ-domain-containing protein [Xylona heveae TC161]KZF20063.1 DnaJ-domain-containing protein [Xylona heveae TC161]